MPIWEERLIWCADGCEIKFKTPVVFKALTKFADSLIKKRSRNDDLLDKWNTMAVKMVKTMSLAAQKNYWWVADDWVASLLWKNTSRYNNGVPIPVTMLEE